MKTPLATFALGLCLAAPLSAQEIVTYSTDQSFDDVAFGLESAILDEGLVIDATSHVGDMLERTRTDVGSDKVLFEAADVYSFCSASLSRKVMEAALMNIAYCPYDIFVARAAGSDETIVGYRALPDGAMQEVQALLDKIAKAAAGLE